MAATLVNIQIRQRLHGILDSLYSSQEDISTLKVFHDRWLGLQDEIMKNSDTVGLEDETVQLTHSVATTVETVFESLANLDSAIEQELQDRLDKVSSLNQSPPTPSSSTPSTPSSSDLLPIQSAPTCLMYIDPKFIRAPYIEQSYAWLLKNLHNPYPSDPVRESIAESTHTRRRDIDHWFTDVRKRIGWIALRHDKFKSRRSMVEAATRYFCPSRTDSQRPLDDEYPGITAQFAAIQARAEDLYAGLVNGSASQMARIVCNDLTPELKEKIKKRRREHAYPSPPHSPDHSSESLSPGKRRRLSDSGLPSKRTRSSPTPRSVSDPTPPRTIDPAAEFDTWLQSELEKAIINQTHAEVEVPEITPYHFDLATWGLEPESSSAAEATPSPASPMLAPITIEGILSQMSQDQETAGALPEEPDPLADFYANFPSSSASYSLLDFPFSLQSPQAPSAPQEQSLTYLGDMFNPGASAERAGELDVFSQFTSDLPPPQPVAAADSTISPMYLTLPPELQAQPRPQSLRPVQMDSSSYNVPSQGFLSGILGNIF